MLATATRDVAVDRHPIPHPQPGGLVHGDDLPSAFVTGYLWLSLALKVLTIGTTDRRRLDLHKHVLPFWLRDR